MSLLDAIITLLDATVEMDDQTPIRRARKRLAKRADALREKRSRRRKVPNPCPQCHARGWVYALSSDDIEIPCPRCTGQRTEKHKR